MGTRKNYQHGMSYTRIYRIYEAIKDRTVLNSQSEDFKKYYKDLGITLCEEWQGYEGFKNFYEWSMKNGYNDTLTIDRIDVTKGYSPENCRWATVRQQNVNRRNTWKECIDGISKPVAEWCEEYKIDYMTVYNRVKRHGWNIEKALSVPKGKSFRSVRKAIPIVQYELSSGALIKEYDSAYSAASENGYSANNIRSCCRGNVVQAYGYGWKYKV